MALPWWKSKSEEGEEKIELPKEIQEQLNQTASLKTEVAEMKTKLGALDTISAWIAEQREAAKPKPTVKTPEQESEESEELAALLLTDPRAAHARLNATTNASIMQLRADVIRRETFEDNAEKFPYYTGEIKSEINKLLAKQPLSFQNSPEALENTYYTVVGKMQKSISEGKIKDRFAAASSSRTGKTEEENGRITLEPNADIEKAAKMLGITMKDYIEMLEKDAEAYI
jgi:hypothetical protein